MKILSLFITLLFVMTISAQDTYLHCGKLIDTKNGKVLTNKTVIVSGKTIKAVNNGFTNPANSNDIVIDLSNKSVMPGFIDMHVHIEGETSPTRT